MRKLIAAINMTLDGYCDHTAIIADDEIHQHYNDLLRKAGLLIYGRITYQLMESYWPSIVEHPTGNEPTDEFATLIDNVPKMVFSRTLQKVDWKQTTLKRAIIREELLALKHQEGRDIFVGSPSMIVALGNLQIIDEYQLCVHPVILGGGLPLFRDVTNRINLTLLNTKIFNCGAVAHYYQPVN